MRLDFCVACGTRENLNHHHLQPRCRGGKDIESNLITVCQYHHGVIHHYEPSNNLKQLIKEGQRKAKLRGVRVFASPEEMSILHALQRKQYLEFCLSLKPYIIKGITRKKQADIFHEKKLPRFRVQRHLSGRWDDHAVLKVIRCLEKNGYEI